MNVCPHCGNELPSNASCCRACGSDAETGWNPDIDYHSVELPEPPMERLRSNARLISKTILAVVILVLLLPVIAWIRSLPTGPELLFFLGTIALLRLAMLSFQKLKARSSSHLKNRDTPS